MSKVCGPFTLDELDAFGDLDGLVYSLDSSVWDTACVHYAGGTASPESTASGEAIRVLHAEASDTTSSTASGLFVRHLHADASAVSTSTTEATHARLVWHSGTEVGTSTGEGTHARLVWHSGTEAGNSTTTATHLRLVCPLGVEVGTSDASAVAVRELYPAGSGAGTSSGLGSWHVQGSAWEALVKPINEWEHTPEPETPWLAVSVSPSLWSTRINTGVTWTEKQAASSVWR